MQLTCLDCGRFRLDAGSMFGRVPKALWGRHVAADDQNRMELAARALLIVAHGRRVLVDSGVGAGRSEKFRRMFAVDPADAGVEAALLRRGISAEDVTDVLLTHLHWDHAGGATRPAGDGSRTAAFPRAVHHVGRHHWRWASPAHPWERGGFLAEDLAALAAAPQHNPLDRRSKPFPGMTCLPHDGHTVGLLMPLLELGGGRRLLFASDLIPTRHHVRLNWIMGFDIQPVATYDVKREVLARAADEGWGVLLPHDPDVELLTVRRDGDDFAPESAGTLAEWLAGDLKAAKSSNAGG
jgi:glyoxylase-like metal-dependent hydrolase (beta-lactamase superfamily II)